MARDQNFLLGKGELLTGNVDVPSGGGDKNPPYAFENAKKRVTEKLQKTNRVFTQIPSAACPGEEVVALLTVHPRYISKSDFPIEILNSNGLRAIGTRPKKIKPESWGIKKHPEEAVAEQIFVAGKKDAFTGWLSRLPTLGENIHGGETLTHIEDLTAFQADDKLRGIPETGDQVLLEVVLHNGGRTQIIQEFSAYAKNLGAVLLLDRVKSIGGLTFLPVRVQRTKAKEVAAFTFVRVARGMPSIRPLPSGITRGRSTFNVELPSDGPISSDTRAVIFDGGLPNSVDLRKWVTYVEPAGIGTAIPACVQHGLGVTSAFLFGPLQDGEKLRQPFCHVDHVRVLGTEESTDLEYQNVLDRILNHLDANKGKYHFINLSLGPDLPVEDDDVNLWTSSLDRRLSSAEMLATVAAGNSGELDADLLLNRVQPPSDGVNVLSIGAADSRQAIWKRAKYSSIGPGRSPGFVKPDGVAFGGSDEDPFMVLQAASNLSSYPIQGTSFAAPFALSGAAGARALAGPELSQLGIRALMVHRAESGEHSKAEVGWGLLHTDPRAIMTCDDHEALVVYQGLLPIGQHLRAKLPVPTGPIKGKVAVRATLLIAPDVDPDHPGAYTKGGLEVSYRPDARKFEKTKPGKKPPAHPKTRAFFSGTNLFKDGEFRLRKEGFKWEPCLRHEDVISGSQLFEPCFDIWYHHRDNAMAASDPKPLAYSLVISLSAVDEPDFYNRVRRTYSHVLVAIQPKVEIPIKT